jgi:hypothetical protein
MSLKNAFAVAVALAAVLAAGACGLEHKSNVLAPTDTNAAGSGATQTVTASMVGTWSSQTTLVPTAPDPKSCGNFQWTVTGQTSTSISGTFSLACGDGVIVSGNGSGTVVNTATVNLTATGTGSMPGIPSCAFALTSVATISDNNNALTVPYTGTTCLGPVHGTETLRKRTEAAAAPAPAPPAPTPPPPAAPSGPTDGIDLHQVVVTGGSPSDVANWPITTAITAMDFGNGVRVDFDKKDGPNRWPDVTPAGWDGPIQYTIWMVTNVGGQWYTSGGVEYWYGLDRSGGPASQFAYNWYYSAAVWGPLANHQPGNGEQVGFFVTAGDARAKDVRAITERSNVVSMPFPSGGGYFTFSSAFRRK